MTMSENGKKPRSVLVTGGAGFIGTHLVRRLLAEGCAVTVLDNFSAQIHATAKLAPDIEGNVRLIRADICDRSELSKAVTGQDSVVHLAAETGTGQSMYSLVQYERVNSLGTATLLEVLATEIGSSVKRLVLASSRAVYGEGKYKCDVDGVVYPSGRVRNHLEEKRFEPTCPVCGRECVCIPTDELSKIDPMSIYGLTKFSQERMVSLCAQALNLSTIVLRYQNVFGPGQSLRNPYTGILAIFSTLARQGALINVFEDGLESRDFVYIDDVVEATWSAIKSDLTGAETFNVGSGRATTVHAAAKAIVNIIDSASSIVVTGQFRVGDIRHNVADLGRCKGALGFQPKVTFEAGLREFIEWATSQSTFDNKYDESLRELKGRGLLHG